MPIAATQLQLDQRLAVAAASGALSILVELLAQGANPCARNSEALREAAEHGHTACVKLLTPISNPKAGESYALQLAAKNGHAGCVSLLIPFSNPMSGDSFALFHAAQRGHAACVQLLLPVSDPSAIHSRALRLAVENGHIECVAILLAEPANSVHAKDLPVLARHAKSNGHLGVAGFLLAVAEQREIIASQPAVENSSPRAMRI